MNNIDFSNMNDSDLNDSFTVVKKQLSEIMPELGKLLRKYELYKEQISQYLIEFEKRKIEIKLDNE